MNFPASPALNDIYSFSGKSWQWNGVFWASIPASTIKVDQLQNSAGSTILDLSAGEILTPLRQPSKPIISGQMGASVTTITGPSKIAFSEFWAQQGGITYNSLNRRFYVPTAGIYRITFIGLTGDQVDPTILAIGKNIDWPTELTHSGVAYGPGSQFTELSLNSVVQMAAGDYFVYYCAMGKVFNSATEPYGQFSIEMIA